MAMDKRSVLLYVYFCFGLFFWDLAGGQTLCDMTQGSNTFNPTCTDSKTPYCVQTIPTPAQYQCVECLSNCDCGYNQFCSQKPGEVGSCVNFDRAGSSCRPLSNGEITDLNYPDQWKCALTYTSTGNNNLQINQAGVCIQGVCQYCDPRGNAGLQNCGVDSGLQGERTCVYPGFLYGNHVAPWLLGSYFENTTAVWWAVIFFFFLVLLVIQGLLLWFTCR